MAGERGLPDGILEQPGEIAGHDLFPRVGRCQQGQRLAVTFADRRHGRPQSLRSALRGQTRVQDDQGVPHRGIDEHELGKVLGFQCARDRIYGVAGPDPMRLVHFVRMAGVVERDNIVTVTLQAEFPD